MGVTLQGLSIGLLVLLPREACHAIRHEEQGFKRACSVQLRGVGVGIGGSKA